MALWLTRDKGREQVEIWETQPTWRAMTQMFLGGWRSTFCAEDFEKETGLKIEEGEICKIESIKLKIKRVKKY